MLKIYSTNCAVFAIKIIYIWERLIFNWGQVQFVSYQNQNFACPDLTKTTSHYRVICMSNWNIKVHIFKWFTYTQVNNYYYCHFWFFFINLGLTDICRPHMCPSWFMLVIKRVCPMFINGTDFSHGTLVT